MRPHPFRILLIGDVVGKPGRDAVRRWLPDIREECGISYVVANVENLAHGKGITKKTLNDLLGSGVDYCTSGNHILNKEGEALLADASVPVLRPANMPEGTPGRGSATVNVGPYSLLLLNLIGTTFFVDGARYANPFLAADALCDGKAANAANGILIDWHAEATSEKVALGWYCDGRVSAVLGTHTHVATDDLRILPKGTAYRSDCGMTGLRDEILGADRGIIIENFLHPSESRAHTWADEGPVQFHAVAVDIDPKTKRASAVQKIDRESEA
jgi:metallophosphoesterase (TIGR00282 family)